jgi:dethiobiotin synthetase
MKGLFVTATDTGAGKTVVTAALAAALRARGLPVRAAKPLATGEPPPGDDARLLARAAGHAPLNHTCLPTPAAPRRAAQLAGVDVDLDGAVAWLRGLGAPLLVEGVGGWEVPIVGDRRVADLGRALGLPVLVVAPNRLGVLNHVLLTVAAVRARGLWVAGVVLDAGVDRPADPALQAWNADDLRAEDLDVARLGAVGDDGLAQAGEALIGALPGVAAALLDLGEPAPDPEVP